MLGVDEIYLSLTTWSRIFCSATCSQGKGWMVVVYFGCSLRGGWRHWQIVFQLLLCRVVPPESFPPPSHFQPPTRHSQAINTRSPRPSAAAESTDALRTPPLPFMPPIVKWLYTTATQSRLIVRRHVQFPLNLVLVTGMFVFNALGDDISEYKGG
ncbi:hypothetical protein EJ03DRAFT_59552 [Teratosphaeria nubilosa]|uniref:Uncharacterized protein n=1 Tax=Teratosphaeria nubilosa TaxID=161662 RepID=A0A6G1LCN2_9PEZI|nr:hypothetical protein EJ03DRAFT_59552 [Teratosphaeria nubilosa]